MALDQPSAATPPIPKTATPHPGENPAIYESVRVYQHSTLFYWWPVWFFGFVCAATTYFGGHHMAIVPHGTKAIKSATVIDKDKKEIVDRDVLVLSEGQHHQTYKDDTGQVKIDQPHVYVFPYRSLGTMYLIILLLVIFV